MPTIKKRCSTCHWFRTDLTPDGRRNPKPDFPYPCDWEMPPETTIFNMPDSYNIFEDKRKDMLGSEGTTCTQWKRYKKKDQ